MKAILLIVSVLSIPLLNGCIDLSVSYISSSEAEPSPYPFSYACVISGGPYGDCQVVPCLPPGHCLMLPPIGFNPLSTDYYVRDQFFEGCGKLYFEVDENGRATRGAVTIGYGVRDTCDYE